MASPQKQALIDLLISKQVLKFGEFTLKSGRVSPYFFNMGGIDDGAGMAALGSAYGRCIVQLGVDFSVLFGPAYKGIPLAVAAGVALAEQGANHGIAFNRKEAKDHGEGGQLVGANVAGQRVILVDDVLTAGTAIREAHTLVKSAGGQVVGVVVAMDRQEKLLDSSAGSSATAVSVLAAELAVPVVSLLCLADVVQYLDAKIALNPDQKVEQSQFLAQIEAYRQQYCV